MKIQVTFDRSTKQKFRDQCVKRLQSFVNEIKNKQQKVPCQRSHTFRPNQDQPHLVQSRTSWREGRSSGVQSKNATDRRGCISSNLSQNSKSINLENVLAMKQNMGEQKQRQSRVNGEAFNLNDIKANLDKIMFKLETNSKIQQLQTHKLQREVEVTNTKLDQLISYLEDQNILGNCTNSKNNSFQTEQAIVPEKPSNFTQKFTQLAERYQKIKLNGVRPEKSLRNSKSIYTYDFEETGDSLTFRNS